MKKRTTWLATTSLLPLFCVGMFVATPAEAAKETKAHKHKAAAAASSRSEITQLNEQLRAVMERLKQLEAQAKQKPAEVPTICGEPCAPVPEIPCYPKTLVVPVDGRSGASLISNCMRVNLTGQVNRALWLADNGHRANLQSVDNNTSSTRFAIAIEGDLNRDITVGGVIQEEINQNSSNATEINNSPNTEISPTTRKAEVYANSKRLGTLFLGHGYMASFSSMQDADLSATTAATAGAKVNLLAGAVKFWNSTKRSISGSPLNPVAGTRAAYTVGTVFDNCDGLGRRDRIRLDLAKIKGFSIQSSYAFDTSSTIWDLGFRYKESWGKTQIAATGFFARNNSVSLTATNLAFDPLGKTHYTQFNGSLGVLFPNGISLFVAGAQRHYEFYKSHKGLLAFTKLGYQLDFFCVGKTAFAINYGYWRDFFINMTGANTQAILSSLSSHTKGNSGGLTAVQFFDKVNTELYITAQTYKMRIPHADKYKPVNVGLFGARISF